MKSLAVAVVDDDTSVLTLVRSILEHKGHRVTTHPSATEALPALAASPPDVLVVDLQMPAMDGATFCARLNAALGSRMPPVLLLSASDDGTLLGQGMDVPGSPLLLRKPFRVPELLSSLARVTGESAGAARVMGGWRLEDELGRGALGVVYRARPVEGGEPVAIKLLQATVASEEDARDLRKELLVLCTLHHPGIVTVRAAGVERGVPYYVMDLIDGPTLGKALTSPWAFKEAAPVLGQVTDAVSYLHRNGVVHRDLKSSNILLDGGKARLVDFGTASLLASRQPQSQAFLGTPAYMAPEMIDGNINSKAVDVFALGVLMYRALSGKWPVEPETRDARHWSRAYASGKSRPLDTVAPGIPQAVASLVQAMLSPAPTERPPVEEVGKCLAPFADV